MPVKQLCEKYTIPVRWAIFLYGLEDHSRFS